MYGSRNIQYGSLSSIPVDTPLCQSGDSQNTPLDNQDGGDYFNYEPQEWTTEQQEQPPGQIIDQIAPTPMVLLDPVEEMERDILSYDPRYSVISSQLSMMPMQMNGTSLNGSDMNGGNLDDRGMNRGNMNGSRMNGGSSRNNHNTNNGNMNSINIKDDNVNNANINALGLNHNVNLNVNNVMSQINHNQSNNLGQNQNQNVLMLHSHPRDPRNSRMLNQVPVNPSVVSRPVHVSRASLATVPTISRRTSSNTVPTESSTPSSETIQSSVPIIIQGEQPPNFYLEELQKCRMRYKPRSSIPPDLSSANYAAQCIAAAESSRLSPYYLSSGEYNHLRNKLPHLHITTYLNIRNGILRLWLSNPLIAVTIVEAAGCCKDARYYRLAEFAFEWLVRNGYINQGCCTFQGRSSTAIAELPQLSGLRRRPRQTIVVIGGGVSGLSCARQLQNLLERYSSQILRDYEDLPRVIVLEGRKRIGGRVYSPTLRTERLNVDLGGDTIMGFGGGNPLGVVLRRQLGIPVVSIDTLSDENVLYDGQTGDPISAQIDYRAHEIFKHLLDRMRNFEMGLGAMSHPPTNAPGVKSLIRAGQDPSVTPESERMTISNYEENLERQNARHELSSSDSEDSAPEIKVELDLLESLGFSTLPLSDDDKQIRVHAEPANQGASLGLTMRKLVEHLASLTNLTPQDRAALNWYFAKFEYCVGDEIDKASLSSWSHHRQNRFTGRHAWTRDGMSSFVRGLDTIPSKLDVRFKTVVNVIEYEDDNAQITLENGEQIMADRVVVTIPLGCLKRRSMQFIPDLPHWKMDSIDRLEYGVVNKVVLLFDEPFWDSNVPSLIRVTCDPTNSNEHQEECRGDCFLFQNHSRRQDLGGKCLIIGLISGKTAKAMTSKPDYEIVEPAVEKLRRIFKNHPRAKHAKLIESVVTRWQSDRFTKGSYSHVGVEGTTTDHDLLARPVLRSLFFAGEGTSRTYPGTIHGAYLSGLRAAKEVLNSIVGGIELPDELFVEDVESFQGYITSASQSLGATPGQDQNNGELCQPQNVTIQPQHNIMRPQLTRQNTQSQLSTASPSIGGNELSGGLNGEAGASSVSKRHKNSPESYCTYESIDISKAEAELAELRRRRKLLEREHLERDLLHEIGPQPTKPERHGTTNPFLLFQKDYWDICRQETEAAKRMDKKAGHVHASRNEIRASLGRKWRSLPEAERLPYTDRSQQSKVENEERQEAYLRKLKWYESEAANFRQKWTQEHPSVPSLRELQLQEQIDNFRPRKKKTRLTD